MRYNEYYIDYCPEFRAEKEIEIEIDSDFPATFNKEDCKIMSYTCADFGDCKSVDKFGDCPLYFKFAKKFRK